MRSVRAREGAPYRVIRFARHLSVSPRARGSAATERAYRDMVGGQSARARERLDAADDADFGVRSVRAREGAPRRLRRRNRAYEVSPRARGSACGSRRCGVRRFGQSARARERPGKVYPRVGGGRSVRAREGAPGGGLSIGGALMVSPRARGSAMDPTRLSGRVSGQSARARERPRIRRT